MEPSVFPLIVLGGLSLYGLRYSLSLSMRHYLFREHQQHSVCGILLKTPQAYIGFIPVAFMVSVYYVVVLILLLRMHVLGENPMELLTPLIMVSLLVTGYYTWLLFFKLGLKCMNCIQIQVTNVLIASACLIYYVLR